MTDPVNTARPTVPTLAPGQVETAGVLEVTTLDDLGGTLPGSGKAYRFQPPTLGVRKRLGQIQGAPELRKYPGRQVVTYLATALQELAGVDLSTMKGDAAALEVARLPVGDVITLALMWKATAHPRGVNIGESRCGACNADFAQVLVKLQDLETKAAPVGPDGSRDLPALLASVGLFQGFPYPAGQSVRTVLVRPPTWIDAWWSLGASGWQNGELVRASLLRASIVAVDTAPVAKIPESSIDGIWPEDQDLIDQALEAITPGPNVQLEIDCPTCGATNKTVIDWMNIGFFGGSSRA